MSGEGQAVSNSTCLIARERIARLELLREAFARVIVPSSVQAEFGRAIEWVQVEAVRDSAVVNTLRTQLEDGEAHAIALAWNWATSISFSTIRKPGA